MVKYILLGTENKRNREKNLTMLPYLIAGAIASLAGLLAFLVVHHFWIMPIWFIFPPGLIIAVLGGLAVGWSYFEIRAGLPPRPWTSPAIVILITLILTPSIILSQLRPPLLDATSVSIPPGEGPRVAFHFFFELILTAMLVGATAGWVLGRSPRAAISTSIAGLAFAIGPGHNIPFLGGTQSAIKGLVLLAVIVLVSSIIIVEGVARLTGM